MKSGKAIIETVTLKLVKRREFELFPYSKAYLKAIPRPVKEAQEIKTTEGLCGRRALKTKPLIKINIRLSKSWSTLLNKSVTGNMKHPIKKIRLSVKVQNIFFLLCTFL